MRLSRRELIALMLGAPALATGCSSPPVVPLHGELFGQSFDIGHRLRDGFRPRPADDQWRDVQVVIVGGGAAGLSAGRALLHGKCDDFVVLELEPVAGGTSRSDKAGDIAYPWGAHYVPVPLADNVPLIRLFTEMGVVESLAPDGSPIVAEQYLCRDPEERLFYQGEWIEGLYPATGASIDDHVQLKAFRELIDEFAAWRDSTGRRAFAIPTSLATDDKKIMELDNLSMADWMRESGFYSPRLHWLVDYSCRDDYGLSAETTSAWAGLLYFAARLRGPGADHQPLISWPEGNGRIINYLAEVIGPRLQTGMAVTQLTPSTSDKGDIVEVICFNTQTQSVTGLRARHVIFAAPQFLAPRLITEFTERTKRKTDEFEYGSWFVANLHLKDRPKQQHGYPLCWDNVMFRSRSLGYVVATHQAGRDYGPTVLTWYYPFTESHTREVREKLLKATWADLADVVLTDLEVPHPQIRQLVERLDIFRWGHAMIRPKPGFISSQQRREARHPDGRIHFANTDLSGVALFEEAFDHGCRAANEVLSALPQDRA